MSNSPTPVTPQTPVRFCDPLPQACDVVVIGAGVIGISAALFLRRAGLSVAVCEKGRVAGEQSSRNWGWIRQLGRDAGELPLAMEASRLWEELDTQTGGRTGFRREGVLYLASTQRQFDTETEWLATGQACGLDVEPIDGQRVADLVDSGPGSKRWAGALWCPSDARAEPWQAVPALAELARSEGVAIREDCAVRALEMVAGRLTGVHTEHGFIACAQAVAAGGAWTSLLLKRHGVSIPQLAVKSSAARSAPMPQVFAGAAADEKLAFRRRADGGYTLAAPDGHDLFIGPDAFRHFFKWLPVAKRSLGQTRFRPWAPKGYPDAWGTPRSWGEDEQSPFERCRVLHPAPDATLEQRIKQRFAERFPSLDAPVLLDQWAGMIDAMPDVVPVVDRVAGLDGVIVACGMSGHGFGIGPAFGKAIAAIAAGRETGHDMRRFRFSRFTDGSRMEPGPGL